MRSHSLQEFGQLAGYLQTRVVPGLAPAVDGTPNEEQLNPDLTLFMKNMQKVDAARQIQITSPRANDKPL